jgi:hypothetical protein
MQKFTRICILLRAAAVVAVACGGAAFAADRPAGAMSPPPILKITKIVAKPGQIAQIEQLEAERTEALAHAGWPRLFVGSVAVTGPQQLWTFARYDTLREISDDLDFIDRNPALKAELERIDVNESALVESRRDVTLTYQKNISYRPDFDWLQVRYWEVIWVHLRNGHHEAYIENRLMTREEHERGAFDTHQMMYAVQSGEQSGTFFVIRPMPDLALLDALHAAGDGEPETPAEERKKIRLFADSSLTEEEAYFRVMPGVSLLTGRSGARE